MPAERVVTKCVTNGVTNESQECPRSNVNSATDDPADRLGSIKSKPSQGPTLVLIIRWSLVRIQAGPFRPARASGLGMAGRTDAFDVVPQVPYDILRVSDGSRERLGTRRARPSRAAGRRTRSTRRGRQLPQASAHGRARGIRRHPAAGQAAAVCTRLPRPCRRGPRR